MPRRGGFRPGAGRKKKAVTAAAQGFYRALVNPEEEAKIWKQLLNSDDLGIKLKAITYIIDRREGKAAQSVKLEGGENPVQVMLIGKKGEVQAHA